MSEHNASHHDPGISALYRRSADEQPGTAVDAAILAAAQRQAGRRRHRRLLSYSSAAVLLLGVTLILRVVDHEASFAPPEATLLEEPAMVAPAAAPMAPPPAQESMPRMRSLPKQSAPAPTPTLPTVAAEGAAPGHGAERQGVAMPPEEWLARIEAILAQGQEGEARAQLQEFVRRYPGAPLPPSLQALRVSAGAE